MKKIILSLGFCLIPLILPHATSAATLAEIYVFGDSQVDNGNLFEATDGVVPESPPYFEGNFSNGPSWVEFLANQLDLEANPANNYAYGGATSGTANVANGVFPTNRVLPGLLSQVEEFTTGNSIVNPHGLYIIEVGRLDYFLAGETDSVPVIDNLSSAITNLTTKGAKNILVANLLDLGKIPASSQSPSSSLLTNLTNLHNENLAVSLKALDATLGANIMLLDFNSLVNDIINEPTQFGFLDVTNPCLSSPGFLIPPFTICSDPDSFLYLDSQHTTVSAQILFADLAYQTLASNGELELLPTATSVPEPFPLLPLFMTTGFGFLSRKRVSKKIYIWGVN